MPFSDCLASRTQITITLWQDVSAINLNSISSWNFRPNMAKYKCNCFFFSPSFKPNLAEMKKEGKKVFNFVLYTPGGKQKSFIWNCSDILTTYKVRVFQCMIGVISSNQGFTHVEMSVRFRISLGHWDSLCIVMTETKVPTMLREFRQLNYSKFLDLPPFFTDTSVEAVHRTIGLKISNLKKAFPLYFSSLITYLLLYSNILCLSLVSSYNLILLLRISHQEKLFRSWK